MTTLDPDAGYAVLINTFTVEPERADDLLDCLWHATEDVMGKQPGFVSANLHLSDDRRYVTNYAQWRTRADIDAMTADPASREHMGAAAGIATSFDPIYYQLRHSVSVADA